jgi:hypothetical protein
MENVLKQIALLYHGSVHGWHLQYHWPDKYSAIIVNIDDANSLAQKKVSKPH